MTETFLVEVGYNEACRQAEVRLISVSSPAAVHSVSEARSLAGPGPFQSWLLSLIAYSRVPLSSFSKHWDYR